MNGVLPVFFIALVIGFVVGFICWPWVKRHRKPPFFNTVIEDNQVHGREYIRLEGQIGMEIWNLDGVDWFDCPIPPRNHRCWTQSRGNVSSRQDNIPMFVRRCACGAISLNDYSDIDIYWSDRNSRKVPK